MKKQTQVFSIFGQIETVVAEAMINEKLVTKIDARDIPATVLYNEKGERAKFAIVIPSNLVNNFNDRVRDLYA